MVGNKGSGEKNATVSGKGRGAVGGETRGREEDEIEIVRRKDIENRDRRRERETGEERDTRRSRNRNRKKQGSYQKQKKGSWQRTNDVTIDFRSKNRETGGGGGETQRGNGSNLTIDFLLFFNWSIFHVLHKKIPIRQNSFVFKLIKKKLQVSCDVIGTKTNSVVKLLSNWSCFVSFFLCFIG
jgi:hypothetical protein